MSEKQNETEEKGYSRSLTYRISDDLWRQMKDVAHEVGSSNNEFVTEAIRQHINRLAEEGYVKARIYSAEFQATERLRLYESLKRTFLALQQFPDAAKELQAAKAASDNGLPWPPEVKATNSTLREKILRRLADGPMKSFRLLQRHLNLHKDAVIAELHAMAADKLISLVIEGGKIVEVALCPTVINDTSTYDTAQQVKND